MKNLLKLSLLLCLLNTAHAIELGPAPEGYTWSKILDGKSAVLVPTGWHFKHTKQGDTEAYFVTKEKIEEGKDFTTGLTINVVKNVSKSTKMKPSELALATVREAAKSMQVLKTQVKENGPFKGYIARCIDKKEGAVSKTIHFTFIANDKTDTLWIYIFEAETKDWEKEWKIGAGIMQKLKLDDEI